MREGLHAITNPKNRKSRFEDEILHVRRVLLIYRFGSAGEDESLRRDGEDLFHRGIPGEQFAIDLRFTHTSCNDLRILRTEIENGNGVHKKSLSSVKRLKSNENAIVENPDIPRR